MENDLENSTTTNCCDGKTNEMLRQLVMTATYFGSEQRDSGVLSLDDKFLYVHKLYHESPPSFIFQFGSKIGAEHLAHLNENFKDDENTKYHLRCLRRDISKRSARISNRRFTAMTNLMSDADYFSEEHMKQRDPLLYQQMVGIYLSEDEIGEQSRNITQNRSNLSDFLFSQMDTDGNNALYTQMKDQEEMEEEESGCLEEDNSDGESDESEMEDDDGGPLPKVKLVKISDEEKQLLRAEFLHTMQERFMSGKDVEFDYSAVDDNDKYDDLNAEELDEQEKYFDDSDSEDDTETPTFKANHSYSGLAEDEYDY